MSDGDLTEATCAALLRKYRLLARWRRTKDADQGSGADQAALRALAAEFPGALRELDLLGLAELDRRVATLVAPPAAEAEPWLSWIVAYHALMREALSLKRQPEQRAPLADDAFARDVARPPGGRLSLVVLRAVARRFDVDPRAVADTLFPPRRPRDLP
ncbi:MAG TPA: hypothetical protein VGP07_04290 [Polyangia bacterium]|jgi:hypothetical protein